MTLLSPPDDIVTLPEAARHLGISRQAVFYRILRGALPAFMMGGRYFIKRADLESAPLRWERTRFAVPVEAISR